MKTYEAMELREIPLEELRGASCMLQSSFWGTFKESQGLTPKAYRYRFREQKGTLLIMVRKLFRFLPIAYVPYGPELPAENPEAFLAALSWALVAELPLGTLFIRYDLNQSYSMDALEARKAQASDVERLILEKPLVKALQDVQPPDTVILPLEPAEEELLAGMHKKWRYNIRLAEKKGVTIQWSDHPDLGEWYEMYRVTSERDKIALHSQSYYQTLFDLAARGGEDVPVVRLLTAHHEGDLLAGIILTIYGGRATYLYGASGNHKRNLMPAYLLQWEAIRQAKQAGCVDYDFFGIPPTNDPSHPMHGLFLIKTGFGGRVHHYPGAWDFPYGKLFYLFYRLAERLRLWYFKSFRKRS